MNTRRFRPFSLAIHDFNRAVRTALPHIKPIAVFEKLCAEKVKVQANANKGMVFALSGAWWCWSANGALSVSVKPFDISIPTAYVNVAVAVAFLGTCLGLLSVVALDAMIGQVSKRHLKIDAPSPLVALFDGTGAWWQLVNRQYRFVSSGRGHRLAGLIVLVIMLLPFLLIFGIIIGSVISVGIDAIRSDGFLSLRGAATFIAWLMLCMPFAIVVLIFTKFEFVKNIGFIRWLFLAKPHNKAGTVHPMVPQWVNQANRLPSSSN